MGPSRAVTGRVGVNNYDEEGAACGTAEGQGYAEASSASM
jgi:hypothetical protein